MVFNNQHQRLHALLIKAEKGNAEAMNELGFIYQEGKLVPQDYQKAHRKRS